MRKWDHGMGRRRFTVAGLTMAVMLPAGLGGCGYHRPPDGAGPPPHAPAHGYRRRHQGVTLVFDAARGVYTVSGRPDHYYFDGRYFRYAGGNAWQASLGIGVPWENVAAGAVPEGLRRAGPGKGPPPGRGGPGAS